MCNFVYVVTIDGKKRGRESAIAIILTGGIHATEVSAGRLRASIPISQVFWSKKV
ncbi:MAG: hypothetical protein J7K84_09275 [Deltaproteobacteria bacterium]|nr:hypothetical protein [Deltaproteobacteria bacterium]